MTDQPANWGSWMVPSLSDAEDMRLRVVELDLQRSVHQEPEAVAALAGQLARQNVQMQAIIRAAAGRMLELEARLAAVEDPQTDPLGPFMKMAKKLTKH